jgi:hypothetical protein
MLARMLNLSSSRASSSTRGNEPASSNSDPLPSLHWDTGSTTVLQDCVSVSGSNNEVITLSPPQTNSSASSPLTSFLDFSGALSSNPIVTVLSKEPLCPGITSFNLSASVEPVAFEVEIVHLDPVGSLPLSSPLAAVFGDSSCGVIVGVAPSYFHSLAASTGGGSILGYSGSGWGYVSTTGEKISPLNLSEPYADPFQEGDRIQCKVDPATNTIEFFKNGISQGVAFSNDELHLPLFAAVSVSGSNTAVSIRRVSPNDSEVFLTSSVLSSPSGPVGLPISLPGTPGEILQKIQVKSDLEALQLGDDWFQSLCHINEVLSLISKQWGKELSVDAYNLILKEAKLRILHLPSIVEMENVIISFIMDC